MAEALSIRYAFRVNLFFHDKLDQIGVGPRLYRDDPQDAADAMGTLRGKGELKRFIDEIELNSIVRDEWLITPSPQLRQTFEVYPSEAIVAAIERRFAAFYEAFSLVLEGTPISEIDDRAFHRFEHLLLGSTKFNTHEGIARLRKWFDSAHSSGSAAAVAP